jgi:hypothetical protein
MSAMRREYFKDLLKDCLDVCEELNIEPDDQGVVIAALIQSDSFNGMRKALMTPTHHVVPRNAAGLASNQY